MLTRMDCFGMTDVGRQRPTNQDHFLIADLNKSLRVHGTSLNLDEQARIYGGSQGKLLIVADGMGGEAEGERASTLAVDAVTTYILNSLAWCFQLEQDDQNDFEEHLKQALAACQQTIQDVAREHPEMRSMGTTMTMVYVVWPRAFVVHVGDSRCYLLRDRTLRQVTTDHTMASVLAQASGAPPETARKSPMGHALWNVLGGRSSDLSVDVYKITLQADDSLLLCTDGLYDMVPHDMLEQALVASTSAEETCRKLVEVANAAGGRDNITLIVAHFQPPDDRTPGAMVEAEVPLEVLTAARETNDTSTRAEG